MCWRYSHARTDVKTKQLAVSWDGTWKIEGEAFKIRLFVYNAFGVTTRVDARSGNGGWRAQKVDLVEANGMMCTFRLPAGMVRLPNSPNRRRNADTLDTRAWNVGSASPTFSMRQRAASRPTPASAADRSCWSIA